jgi:hypothetical protein
MLKDEESFFLLDRIKSTKEIRKWATTKRNIYIGCYDVFHGDEEMEYYNSLKNYQLRRVQDLGYAYKDSKEEYHLTNDGEVYLETLKQLPMNLEWYAI